MRILAPRFSVRSLLVAVAVLSCLLGSKIYSVRQRCELLERVADGRVPAGVTLIDSTDRWGVALMPYHGVTCRFVGHPYSAYNFEMVQEVSEKATSQALWEKLWQNPTVVDIVLVREKDAEAYQSAFPEADVWLPTPRLESLGVEISSEG